MYSSPGLLAITFAMLTVGNLLWHTMMQRLVPPDRLGRASSVDWLFSLCLTPLGVLIGGVLATSFGVRKTLLLGGSIGAAACLVVIFPRVREPERSGLFDPEPAAALPEVPRQPERQPSGD